MNTEDKGIAWQLGIQREDPALHSMMKMKAIADSTAIWENNRTLSTIKSGVALTQSRNCTRERYPAIWSSHVHTLVRSRIDLAEKWIQTSRLWGPDLLRSLNRWSIHVYTWTRQRKKKKKERERKENRRRRVPSAGTDIWHLGRKFPNKICSRQLSPLPKAPINFLSEIFASTGSRISRSVVVAFQYGWRWS